MEKTYVEECSLVIDVSLIAGGLVDERKGWGTSDLELIKDEPDDGRNERDHPPDWHRHDVPRIANAREEKGEGTSENQSRQPNDGVDHILTAGYQELDHCDEDIGAGLALHGE